MSDAALRDHLLASADDRLILGHRLSEWCGHAPFLEEDLALANIALDFLGQAQTLYEWAGTADSPPRSADDLVFFRNPTEYRNLLLVEQPNGDFAMTIVRQFLFDHFDRLWLDALSKGTPFESAALREWRKRASTENRYHLRHSEAWLQRLGGGTEESHARAQRALETLWPYSEELFPPRDPGAPAGLPEAASLREVWRAAVEDAFAKAHLVAPTLPPVVAKGGRQGIHSEHLERLLSEMQSLARAHPGAEW